MMESPDSPLVLTKLRAPRVRPGSISRARLLERLAPERGADLTLVCAPAGYGKTTLLAEWAQTLGQNGAAVAWVGLDAGDDAPGPFGAYLVAALTQALGATPELAASSRLLRSSPEIDLQRILPAVINAAAESGRECALILDDYHLIRSPAVHSALAYLLERLPENLRVYLGSRSDPPLPLARLRARGRLLEIRAADLRFSPAETACYLNEVMRLGLPEEAVAALDERTEGWAAGLQLAALSLASRADKESFLSSFTGSHRYLVEYLLEEVFNRQTPAVRGFLLATALLERMCAPLCDAVLAAAGFEPRSPAQDTLAQLEQLNLFLVALDDEGRWYRYHHLFRDFLRARLERDGTGHAAKLRRAAAEWLAANGLLREAGQQAFEHARQSGEWGFAAAFVEAHGFTLITHSEMALMAEWCAAFPEEIMPAHPQLCILQCWPWVFHFQSRDRARIEARLSLAEQAGAAGGDAQAARDLSEHAAVVRAFLSMAPDPQADARAQLELAERARRAYPEGDAGQFSALLTLGYGHMALYELDAAQEALESARQIALRARLYAGVVESSFHLARLTQARGQLERAAQICRQALADLAALLEQPEQQVPAISALHSALGCVELEQDHLEAAERELSGGVERMGWGAHPYYLLTAYTALFRLRQIQGRPAEALAWLDRLEAAWPDIAFCTQALRAAINRQSAPGECPSPLPGMGPFGAAEAYSLALLARLQAQIANGEPRAALACLEPALDRASRAGMTTRVIELSLLEAQAAQALGDETRAGRAIERALSAGEAGGYVRVFDQGSAVIALLGAAARRGVQAAYARRVLAALSGRQPAEPERGGVELEYGERLSERELEVLRLMAAGASNQAIAARLVISLGTVKSHINHILGKLDARNRTEAVAKARALGLLAI